MCNVGQGPTQVERYKSWGRWSQLERSRMLQPGEVRAAWVPAASAPVNAVPAGTALLTSEQNQCVARGRTLADKTKAIRKGRG